MNQHAIDLMPSATRARAESRMRTGRIIAIGLAVVAVLVLVTTHAHMQLDRARDALATTEERANSALATEARANELRAQIAELETMIGRYERIAMPFDVSSLMSSLVNELPSGVTFDRVDLHAGAKRAVRTARSRGTEDDEEAPPRVMTVELAGFAPDDRSIAEYVTRLETHPLFEKVSLDFSRTRVIRERTAREFRLSLVVDLERRYDVAPTAAATATTEEEGGA